MDQRIGNRRERWILLAILALALFARFFRLGHQSLWTDEMLSIGAYTVPPGIAFWKKLLWDVHGPLYSLLLHFWSTVSSSEAWLRTPSALAGVLSVYLVYRWLVSLGRRDCALIGALFFALSPFNLYYSQELRFYAQLTLCLIVSLIVFQRYLTRPTCANGVLLGVSLAVTCLSHFSGGFLCIGLFVYLVITRKARGAHLRAGLLAAVILLAVISPWIYREFRFLQGIRVVDVSTIPVEERYRGELTLSAWSYPYAFYAFSVGYSFGPTLRELHRVESVPALLETHGLEMVIVGCLFGVLTILGLIRAARTGVLALFLSIALTTILSVSALIKFNIKIFNARYLISAFPVFIALLAYGVPARGWRRYSAVIAVCAVMAFAGWNYHLVDAYARDDVRGAVRLIDDREVAGDLIIAPSVVHTVRYYYGGPNEVTVLFPRDLGAAELQRRIERQMQEHGRVWYVRCRHWDTDPDDLLVTAYSAEAEAVESWSLPGVIVYLFHHTPHLPNRE
ncbi:MAG TPA: glycosyltransferase family 39 protein [Patescibacteria group bacterium]|nr:glycosyltransferase family 39 protein [Patescibacteria group bacterium]